MQGGEALTTTTTARALRSKRRRCCDAGVGQDTTTTTTTSTSTTNTATASSASDPAAAALDPRKEALDHQEPCVAATLVSSSSHQQQHSYFSNNNLPSELIAQHVAGFCDRKSQAAVEATCRKFRNALRDNMATTAWHFPLSGRFLINTDNNNNNASNANNKSGKKKSRSSNSSSSNNPRLRFVVLSSEEEGRRCRRLVSYKSRKDRFNEGRLEVWDACFGCLLSLERVRFPARSKPLKPAISVGGRWVACGNITYGNENNFQDGILLIRLPAPEQQQHKQSSGVVTQRVLEEYDVTSVQFLNNDENETVLVFSHLGMDGFLCCKVGVENNASDGDDNVESTTTTATITVTAPSSYIQYPIHVVNAPLALVGPDNNNDPGHQLQLADGEFSTVGYGRMAVYNSNNNNGSGTGTTRRRRSLEAFVYSSYDGYVVIRDVLRDVVVTRKVPKDTVEVFDIAFSPDGRRLLLSHFEDGLSVLDNCDSERIEDVGEIEILRLSSDDNNNNVGSSSGSGGATRRTGGTGSSNSGRSQYGYFSFSPDSKRVVALNMAPMRQFPHVIDLENRRLLVSRDWDDDLSWKKFLFGVAE